MGNRPRLALALDVSTSGEAKKLAEECSEFVDVFKIGLELYTSLGPVIVKSILDYGVDIFLDLKLHDIPATVERTVRVVGDLGVRYLTLHTSGGAGMLEMAKKASLSSGVGLLGVTVLTSLDGNDLISTGSGLSVSETVLKRAALAKSIGIEGIVASAAELDILGSLKDSGLIIVTPGIREEAQEAQDQKRVLNVSDAVRMGSDILVVGRPIRDAHSPREAARQFAMRIDEVSSEETV
ncbi:MAG: orotidine-5'-phosphate decarboxylase [Deltaproteobacteria bacterium]|nr:orotidine-5'-phosphate decarboxylase [Deltaproteobacteria bacterium]